MAGEKAISFTLRATAAVYNLCGGAVSPNPRVWLGQRRQGTGLPAATIELDTTDPTDSKDGASGVDLDYVLVYNYAGSLEAALQLADATRAAVDKAITGTINTVKVQTVQFMDRNYFQDGQDPTTHVYEDRYKVRVTKT